MQKMQLTTARYTSFSSHHLSNKYQRVEGLPLAVDNMERLPEEVDEWLQYFMETKPHFRGRDIYIHSVWTEPPFPKFIKKKAGGAKNMASGHPLHRWRSLFPWGDWYFCCL